jgi:hypothetical protein
MEMDVAGNLVAVKNELQAATTTLIMTGAAECANKCRRV